MKTFKIIDFWFQSILISACLAAIGLEKLDFYYAYFIVGGAQFISMVIHEVAGYRTARGTERRFYHNITYILIGCMLLTPLIYITGIIFFLLIFAAPFMAVYYCLLCYKETYVYMKRPLSILK